MDRQNTLWQDTECGTNILDQVAMEPALKTEAPGLRGGVRSWSPRPGLACPSPTLLHSPIYTVGRAMWGQGPGWREGSRKGRAGSRPGPEAGPWRCGWGEGPDSGWVAPRGPRGAVRSLWGLAGQLLLVEAHDMVHKLVLFARLDHAAPARQRCTMGVGLVRDVLWEGVPKPTEYQSFVRGLVSH